MGVRVPPGAAFLQAHLGGGAFDDVFGDAASLPTLRRILEAVRLYKLYIYIRYHSWTSAASSMQCGQ